MSQISFKIALLTGQRTTQAKAANHSKDFREYRFPVVLNFQRECWNPVKKHSKALMFFAVSNQIPIVYAADRGRAEIIEPKEINGLSVALSQDDSCKIARACIRKVGKQVSIHHLSTFIKTYT